MRMTRQATRGSVLMYVLVIGAILLVGVASMFGSVNMSIASGEKFSRQQDAESVARSAIHEVIAKFKGGDFEFKDDVEIVSGNVVSSLTFKEDLGRPYSTNNLISSAGVTGWNGQLVPPKCAHLVAVAKLGSESIVLEMIVNQTAFPWSVASNGFIQGNDMEVFALNSKDEAVSGITDNQKLKSNILSNSASGSSIILSGSSVITGDARAVKNIELLGASRVEGKLEDNRDPVTITLDKRAEDYRPQNNESLIYNPGDPAPLNGRYETSGNTLIGDLKFEDGMLFVDGSVTVTGKITGNGALVATGDITITGSMNTSADLAALVAGGDIVITGQGANTSSFRGLILAEGSFRAKDTTLIGSALTLDQNGSVQLERVKSVAAKDLMEIDLSYAVALKNALRNNSSRNPIGVLYETNQGVRFVELKPENYEALEALAIEIAKDGAYGKVVVKNPDGTYEANPSEGWDSMAFSQKKPFWEDYESEVKANAVTYEEIFQLDFNKFLKTKGGFRPLLQRVSSL